METLFSNFFFVVKFFSKCHFHNFGANLRAALIKWMFCYLLKTIKAIDLTCILLHSAAPPTATVNINTYVYYLDVNMFVSASVFDYYNLRDTHPPTLKQLSDSYAFCHLYTDHYALHCFLERALQTLLNRRDYNNKENMGNIKRAAPSNLRQQKYSINCKQMCVKAYKYNGKAKSQCGWLLAWFWYLWYFLI